MFKTVESIPTFILTVESILEETNSVTFEYKRRNTTSNSPFAYSKAMIHRVLKSSDWGDPNKLRELRGQYHNYNQSYNYWDYMDAWTYSFFYQNPQRKHSWFFYFDEDFKKENNEIPN